MAPRARPSVKAFKQASQNAANVQGAFGRHETSTAIDKHHDIEHAQARRSDPCGDDAKSRGRTLGKVSKSELLVDRFPADHQPAEGVKRHKKAHNQEFKTLTKKQERRLSKARAQSEAAKKLTGGPQLRLNLKEALALSSVEEGQTDNDSIRSAQDVSITSDPGIGSGATSQDSPAAAPPLSLTGGMALAALTSAPAELGNTTSGTDGTDAAEDVFPRGLRIAEDHSGMMTNSTTTDMAVSSPEEVREEEEQAQMVMPQPASHTQPDGQLPPSTEADFVAPSLKKGRGLLRRLPIVLLAASVGVLGALAASRGRRR